MFLQPAGHPAAPRALQPGFREARRRVDHALYRDNGFRDCKVTASVADDYQGKKGDVAVTLEIEEGPQYTVGTIDCAGHHAKGSRGDPGAPRLAARAAVQRKQRRPGPRQRSSRLYQSSGYPGRVVRLAHRSGAPGGNR